MLRRRFLVAAALGLTVRSSTAFLPAIELAANASEFQASVEQTFDGAVHAFWVFDGSSERVRLVLDTRGVWRELHLADTLAAQLGDPRKLRGVPSRVIGRQRTDGGIDVSAVAFVSYMLASAAPLTGPTPFLTLLCRFSGSSIPHPASYFDRYFASSYPGIDHYWRDQSNGLIDFTGSRVVGWIDLPDTAAGYQSNPATSLQRVIDDCMSGADPLVHFPDYYAINILVSTTFNGLAQAGSGTFTRDGVTKTYGLTELQTGEAGCWPNYPSCGSSATYEIQSVFAHEVGHVLGLPHSSGSYGTPYDSDWDVMSGSTRKRLVDQYFDADYGFIAMGTIAYHKDILGWIPSDRKYVAQPNTRRVIRLARLAQPSASDFLMAQIPVSGSAIDFYTVEARMFSGYDVRLPAEAVILHRVNTTRHSQEGHARVIDPDLNGDPNDHGARWLPGETFADAVTGVSVDVVEATSSGYSVGVTLKTSALSVVSISNASPFTTGGEAITISGTGFAAGAAVTIGGTAATSVVVVDSGTLTAVTPPHAAGSVDVTVAASGGPAFTLLSAATYVAPATPAIGTHPVSQTISPGQNAQFTVAATGNPSPTYQWQISTNGGASFTDLSITSPYSGVATATLTVTAATTGLSGAQYRAVATNIAGSVTSNPATLTVAAIPPTMSVDRTALAFGATMTAAAFSSQTGSQAIRLLQNGPGTVTWTAASNRPWLVVSPVSGSGSATLTVAVQFASGLVATQSGTVTLTFVGAANTAGPIEVTLTTMSPAASTAPHGFFDTPADGSTGVAGSVAVTGWAIDDVEVTRVRIFRDPVQGEAGARIFIGDAVLVDGARPDVAASYPTAPRNTRAGWGYLMLTLFLPNLGNGTFTLHAIADDADGHSTTLGSKTITCANSVATAPFGAIDTPDQGMTVSGTINNFGWVLSPGTRRADPPGGGDVRVVIDGAIVGSPGGWASRSDLTALFPSEQFRGVGSALGVYTLDTTTLSNGVHTIAWVVTDNQGGAAGVGSRYFTVANGSAVTRDPTARLNADATPSALTGGGIVTGRRGFDLDAPRQTYRADGGRVTIQAEELDRIELDVGIGVTGHARVAGALKPLPTGARLDQASGVFTWHPGVGFLGAYDFVFGDRELRIVLNPKGSGRVGVQTIIDSVLPPRGGGHPNDQTILGWAADLDSHVDSGVDAIHVWAYPVQRASGQYGDPIWMGAAQYGGERPDVAAVYGERFRTSGYELRVAGLEPGTYDVAVFAYSTVKRGFAAAKVVRVTVGSNQSSR